MVRFLKPLAIAMLVNGGLAVAMALMFLFGSGLVASMAPEEFASDPAAQSWGTTIYALLGAYCGISGGFQLFAGWKLLKLDGVQARTLALWAVAVGAFNTPLCCCLPLTSVALAIAGVIILLSSEVVTAFGYVAQGATREQVLAQFGLGTPGGGTPPAGGPPPPAAPPMSGPPPPRTPPSQPPPGFGGGPPPPRSL